MWDLFVLGASHGCSFFRKFQSEFEEHFCVPYFLPGLILKGN